MEREKGDVPLSEEPSPPETQWHIIGLFDEIPKGKPGRPRNAVLLEREFATIPRSDVIPVALDDSYFLITGQIYRLRRLTTLAPERYCGISGIITMHTYELTKSSVDNNAQSLIMFTIGHLDDDHTGYGLYFRCQELYKITPSKVITSQIFCRELDDLPPSETLMQLHHAGPHEEDARKTSRYRR